MLVWKPPTDPDESLETKVCSNRYVYYGDVKITEENPLDFGLLKAVTGEDTVNIFGVPTKPRCLVALASNNLKDYSPYQCEVGTVQHHKRDVSMLFSTPFDRSVDVAPVYGLNAAAKMLSTAVAVRLHYSSMPPLSVESLVVSLCKSHYLMALTIVRGQIGAPVAECLKASYALAISMRMPLYVVVQNAKAISPHHCGVCDNGVEYIRDIVWTGQVR